MCHKIISCIVLYNPEEAVVENIKKIKAISSQVVVVVNYCDERVLSTVELIDGVHIIRNLDNIGLAKALNTGIKKSIELGAEYVALFDQDSIPIGNDFFNEMILVFRNNPQVASIGPLIDDEKSDSVLDKKELIYLNTIITSGSLTPISVFEKVGLMDETLFIDYIDYEWCLRVIEKGYKVCQTSKSRLKHNMGDVFVKFLWMKKPYHKNKLRQYYIVRNQLIMLNRSYIPLSWKVKQFVKLLYRLPIYYLLSDDKKTTYKHIKNAFIDFYKNKKIYKSYVY